MFPVPGECLVIRPKVSLLWTNDAPLFECGEMAGSVVRGGELTRQDDCILSRYAHQPRIKRPVTQLAERHSISRVIVMAHTPIDDVGGVDGGVVVQCSDGDPAERAAVVVGCHHGPAEALIANRRWRGRGFLYLLVSACLLQESLAVEERLSQWIGWAWHRL